jgi:hypothetical protein
VFARPEAFRGIVRSALDLAPFFQLAAPVSDSKYQRLRYVIKESQTEQREFRGYKKWKILRGELLDLLRYVLKPGPIPRYQQIKEDLEKEAPFNYSIEERLRETGRLERNRGLHQQLVGKDSLKDNSHIS